MIKNKSILITGGCGFVGTNLAIYLKNELKNFSVYSVDSLKKTYSNFNLNILKKNKIINFRIDICSEKFLKIKRKFDFGMAPIPVYDLNNVQIKSIDDVFIECYDYDDCHYELTSQDREELSLYASLIENGGSSKVPEPYSLGLIRSRFTSNVLGMYTEGFSQLNNQIGFWIRLESDGGRFYSNLNKHEQLVTMLDLAIHERAHYDTPTYNNNEAHCDGFQSTYNFLFQQAGRNYGSFVTLIGHLTNAGEETEISTTDSILIGLLCFFGIVAFVFALLYFRVESNQPRYDNLNY